MLSVDHWLNPTDVMDTALNVAAQLQPELDLGQCHGQLNHLREQCQQHLEAQLPNAAAFADLLRFLYRQQGFHSQGVDGLKPQHCLLPQVLAYRTGTPVAQAVLLLDLARCCGFEVAIVNFYGQYLLRYQALPGEYHYIEPMSGIFVSDAELLLRYQRIMGEDAEAQLPADSRLPANHQEIIAAVLHSTKAAFISQEQFAQALIVVELLVQLSPNDPYERRDRGFLLHQLDCERLAAADYQFFIRRCPQDPATPLLQLHISQLQQQSPILH